jgi:hypothetical protein
MPEIADVVPGQDVLAEWGNQVRDRAVSRYTTQAALETAEPGAPNGSLRWTDDNGLLIKQGGVWLRLVNATGDNPRFEGNVIVQAGASGQGYWIKPDDLDNTQDWRMIDSAGSLIFQSRASGSFQTVFQIGSAVVQLASNSVPAGGVRIGATPLSTSSPGGTGYYLRWSSATGGMWRTTTLQLQADDVPAGVASLMAAAAGDEIDVADIFQSLLDRIDDLTARVEALEA